MRRGNLVVIAALLVVGGTALFHGESGQGGFQGLIEEVRIYNRALTAAEIQTDMERPVTP